MSDESVQSEDGPRMSEGAERPVRFCTDRDGDLWQSIGKGFWRCLTTESCDVAGGDLVNVCGPLQELVAVPVDGGVSVGPVERDATVGAQVEAEKLQALTFDEFSRVNAQRCVRWHPGFPFEDSWTLADWSNALCGEAGELANVIKKIRRIDTAHFSKRADEQDRADLVRKAGDEIGDVMAYLDLLATKLGLRVGVVTAVKFDAISEREGYPERVAAAPVDAPMAAAQHG